MSPLKKAGYSTCCGVSTMDQTYLGNVRDQSSNFVWLGEPQNSGVYPKHYGGFHKDGTDINVNSFVLVLPEGEFHYIGYIEDLCENENGSKEAKLRWFHRYIEVKNLFPDLDQNSEEIYISQSIGLIDVETIDSIATVLTPDHYSRCLDFEDTFFKPLSNCGIYMCCKEIADGAILQFDLSQLPGYSNQRIFSLFHSHEESTNQSSELPCGNPSMQFVRRPRSDRRKKQKIVQSGDLNSNSEEQIANSGASCSNSGNEIIENEQMPPKMKLKRLMHSIRREHDGSDPVENFEVLSPRFPGRWFRCRILLKSSIIIMVKYHDCEAAGGPEEVLLPDDVAPRDRLGMRLAGRTTLRPSPPHDSSNNSFQLGGSVDVWLHGAWCEGVFISLGDISTPDRFLVFLPDENILGTYHISDVRVSKDWVDNEWKEVPRKPDILFVIASVLAPANANPPA